MAEFLQAFSACSLFKGLSRAEISMVLQIVPYQIKTIAKGEPLAIEGDPCPGLGILTKGSAEIQRVYASGKSVTIDTLNSGDSFGEIILFSDVSCYPVTIITREAAQAVFLSKKAVVNLCSTHPVFLNNLLRQLSNRILLLNQRIKSLSYQTIRQKVADLLLAEYRRQGSIKLSLQYSRKEMAELLDIPRPSLSRELAMMKGEGLIEFRKNDFLIRDVDGIEECLID